MLLDLSLTDEWLKVAEEAIRSTIPVDVIIQVQRLAHDELYSDTLEYLLDAYDKFWITTSFEELEIAFDTYFCSRYEYIKGFHACRITNESSYKNNGIRGMCKELLVELALDRFGKHTSSGKIISACEKTKIDEYDSSVFMFPALERAKEPSQNHYLKCGSEILQGLAWDLGLGNQGILSKQGQSCVIECEVPLINIKPMFRLDFWRQFITFSFQKSLGKQIEPKAPDWGFAANDDIDRKHINFFHYIKDSDYTYRLLRH